MDFERKLLSCWSRVRRCVCVESMWQCVLRQKFVFLSKKTKQNIKLSQGGWWKRMGVGITKMDFLCRWISSIASISIWKYFPWNLFGICIFSYLLFNKQKPVVDSLHCRYLDKPEFLQRHCCQMHQWTLVPLSCISEYWIKTC